MRAYGELSLLLGIKVQGTSLVCIIMIGVSGELSLFFRLISPTKHINDRHFVGC